MPFRHWSTPDDDGSGVRGSVDNSGRGRSRGSGAAGGRPVRGSSPWENVPRGEFTPPDGWDTGGGARVSHPPGGGADVSSRPSRGNRGDPGPALGGRVGYPLSWEESTGMVMGLPLTLEKVHCWQVVAEDGRPLHRGDVSALSRVTRKCGFISIPSEDILLRSTSGEDATTTDCVWSWKNRGKSSSNHLSIEEGVAYKESTWWRRPTPTRSSGTHASLGPIGPVQVWRDRVWPGRTIYP